MSENPPSAKKKRWRSALLLILGLYFFSADIHRGLEWVSNSEYRKFLELSKTHQPLFEERLKTAFESRKKEIWLKDLAPFEWDKVCYIGEYSVPRSIIAKNTALKKDFKILGLVPDFEEREEGFVFLNHDRVSAIIRRHGTDIDAAYGSCAGRAKAQMIAVPSASWNAARPINFKLTLANLRTLGDCKNNEKCAYIFTGE